MKILSEMYDRREHNAIERKGKEREMIENDQDEVGGVVRNSGLMDCAGLHSADESWRARRYARNKATR